MSSHMVHGSSVRVRVPRHLANGREREREQVSNLFSLRAKQEMRRHTFSRLDDKAFRKHAHECKLYIQEAWNRTGSERKTV